MWRLNFFLVTNRVVIEFFFQLPIMWRLIFFPGRHTYVDLGCPMDNGLISTIDLAMKFGLLGNKMYTLHVNIHFLF